MKIGGKEEVYFDAMRFTRMRFDIRDPNAYNFIVDGKNIYVGEGGLGETLASLDPAGFERG